MDSAKGTFEFHLKRTMHNVLIPTLDSRLGDALRLLTQGDLTPEKYTYYLMYCMLNGFGVVREKVSTLESQNAIFKKQIHSLQDQINRLKR